jgi:FAD/FMN-containing dehydrogenase
MAIDDATIEQLRFGFRGDLIRPGEPGYEEGRSVWNGMFSKRPALIARCTGNADVVAAVNFARTSGLPVAVRGGGHSVAGFSTLDDGVVIDLTRMRGVRVDPDAKTARVQGGATWGDYDRETQVYGLASPGGLVSTTGVAGLTLGGGFGFLSMKHGLACDNLIGADVVTADGRVVQANEKENPDLLWGLRGGGGNFGVVTSFEFKVHPLSEVVVSLFLYAPEQAADLLAFYRTFLDDAPEALTAFISFMTIPENPPMPIFPPEVLGKKVVAFLAAWPGSQEEGEKAVAGMRAFAKPLFELALPLPYTMAQSIQDDDAPWGDRHYWKSAYCGGLTNGLIEAIAAHGSNAPSPKTQVAVGRFGGAIAKGSAADSAFPLRDAGWLVQMDSSWEDASSDDANIAWTRGMHAAVSPFLVDDRVYVNFIGDEGADRAQSAYGAERYAKLVALKDAYDPTNFFRLNQNIRPSA